MSYIFIPVPSNILGNGEIHYILGAQIFGDMKSRTNFCQYFHLQFVHLQHLELLVLNIPLSPAIAPAMLIGVLLMPPIKFF